MLKQNSDFYAHFTGGTDVLEEVFGGAALGAIAGLPVTAQPDSPGPHRFLTITSLLPGAFAQPLAEFLLLPRRSRHVMTVPVIIERTMPALRGYSRVLIFLGSTMSLHPVYCSF